MLLKERSRNRDGSLKLLDGPAPDQDIHEVVNLDVPTHSRSYGLHLSLMVPYQHITEPGCIARIWSLEIPLIRTHISKYIYYKTDCFLSQHLLQGNEWFSLCESISGGFGLPNPVMQ